MLWLLLEIWALGQFQKDYMRIYELLRRLQPIIFPVLPATIRNVVNLKLSYIDPISLYEIKKTIDLLEKEKINGLFIEAGCALGGSAIVIADAKRKNRKLFVFDVFDMIPPPTKNDGDDAQQRYQVISQGHSKGIQDNLYYGYEWGLLEKVKKNFLNFGINLEDQNIQLIEGTFQDRLHVNNDVAFAHIDSDWYDSVMTCLRRIEPYLVSKGTFVIDDYYHWEGCKKAVDNYFRDKLDNYYFIEKSRLHIIRK